MPTLRKDMKDKTIGVWKVINFSHKGKPGCYFWKVKCQNCKTIYTKETGHINKKFGCRNCHQRPLGFSGTKRLYGIYKRHVKKANRPFEIILEQFILLTSSRCYYCGKQPKQKITNNSNKDNKISVWGDFVYNGIDRKDNSVGYIFENCIPCCGVCNWAKYDRSFEEFKNYILTIVQNAQDNKINFIGSSDGMVS